MSKFRGPRLRIVRRLGELSAFVQKLPIRRNPPGQHGNNVRKPTQFSYHLIEKQKLRFYYGISEKQLIRYVKTARKIKGSTGQILLRQLEIRLDNVIYRLGWAPTIPYARQIVNHDHILVNQNNINIPSFLCLPYQRIIFKDKRYIRTLVKKNLQECARVLPNYLFLNVESLTAGVHSWADRREVTLNLNELLVIEYYSNRL